jgi:RimJ/RimL family protein N-acetyltransferase
MLMPSMEIQTSRLTIRPVVETDLAGLLAIHSVDEVNRFLPYVTWTGMADAHAWFERVTKRQDDGVSMQFVLVEKNSNTVVGSCVLFGIEPESARAELGYAIGKPYWRSGLMREALTAFIGFAFDELALRRLDAQVDPRNTASHQLLLRMGFTHEGMLRQRAVVKGEIKDANVYGLLRHEWPPAG